MADSLTRCACASWRRLAIVFLPTLALVLCLFLLFGSETAVKEHFAALRAAHSGLTAAMTAFSTIGNIAAAAVYAVLLGWGLWRRDAGLEAFVVGAAVAFVIAALAASLCKMAVGRPRPMVSGGFMPFAHGDGHRSFPSGHVFEASALALPLSRRYGRLLLPVAAGCFVALMAFSRIYLGKHHPSDIVGGLLFGAFAGFVAAKAETLILARLRPTAPKFTDREKH